MSSSDGTGARPRPHVDVLSSVDREDQTAFLLKKPFQKMDFTFVNFQTLNQPFPSGANHAWSCRLPSLSVAGFCRHCTRPSPSAFISVAGQEFAFLVMSVSGFGIRGNAGIGKRIGKCLLP